MIKRFNKNKKEIFHRINKQISGVTKVRLIKTTGISIISFKEALNEAESQNLDLVEIAVDKDLPVCKIIDYGKFRFDFLKKKRDNKKKQHQVSLKEIKLGPRISQNDFEIKQKKTVIFLEKGNKVKISLRFRGREMMYTDVGLKVVEKLIDNISEFGSPERKPALDGRQIIVIIIPKK